MTIIREMRVRMCMTLIINLYIRRIIISTAPVFLSAIDVPAEFLKDCLAVFFIVKLHELPAPVNWDKDLREKEDVERRSSWRLPWAGEEEESESESEA
mmetsp:Transcript_52374/g.103952  ORF Transcript_52374/g.103952 Transcript_52374/m.103952 type:complete len:98 (+) Transcript_52374:2-295(+)